MEGLPTPLSLREAQPLQSVLPQPLSAQLYIGLLNYCAIATVDWTVYEGVPSAFQAPKTGTGRFTLVGRFGNRLTDIVVGQSLTFDLSVGNSSVRVATHRVAEVRRRIRYVGTELRVEVTVLSSGPLERLGRVRVRKITGDTWPAQRDSVRADMLFTRIQEGMKGETIKPTSLDPAMSLTSDSDMMAANADGSARHWGDETGRPSLAWVIVDSPVTDMRAERSVWPTGTGSLRSLRPHMVDSLDVVISANVSGNCQARVGLLYSTTAEGTYSAPSTLAATNWVTVAGNNAVVAPTGGKLTLPGGTRWVRAFVEFRSVVGTVGVERVWAASSDPVAIGRVDLTNYTDADIENKPASTMLDHFAKNAHAGFFETRSGRLTYSTFARLNGFGPQSQPVRVVLDCDEVLSDTESVITSADWCNRLIVGYGDGKELTVDDSASINAWGIYEDQTGGEVANKASAVILAQDFMDSVPSSPSTDQTTGKARVPRERISRLTTVPFHMLPSYKVIALLSMPALTCVRIDGAPMGFPSNALDQWVGAVLSTELRGGSHRSMEGVTTLNVSMTLNVLDMTRVEAPALTVAVSRATAIIGETVGLTYSPATGGVPVGATVVWQRKGPFTDWTTHGVAGNPASWQWVSNEVGTSQWRVQVTTLDNTVWNSNEVSVEITPATHATEVRLTAPDGALPGTGITLSAALTPAGAAVTNYRWEYRAGESEWLAFATGNTNPLHWTVGTGLAGPVEARVVAVHIDGFELASAPEPLWLGSSFTAQGSLANAPVGTPVTLSASLTPGDHGATAVGWQSRTGGGAWSAPASTDAVFEWVSAGTPDSAVEWRYVVRFADGTELATDPVTVYLGVHRPDVVKTVTLTATATRTYTGTGGTERTDTARTTLMYYGWYSTSWNQQRPALWFALPEDLRTAKSIDSATLKLTRNAGGDGSGKTLKVGVHKAPTTPPSTWAGLSATPNLGTITGPSTASPTITRALPTAVVNALRDANGLVLGPETVNNDSLYNVMHGAGASTVGNRPVLTITYTVAG